MRRIYTASSWKNQLYPEVVKELRSWGHFVHDFRDPTMSFVFQWTKVDPRWEFWTKLGYVQGLQHENAQKGFQSDRDGILWSDTCVLILPCGKSAHLELGYAAGKGKQCHIYLPEFLPPEAWDVELMYKFVEESGGGIHLSLFALKDALSTDLNLAP
jgi:hypothetical protein